MVISQAMHFAFEEREHADGFACRDDGRRLVAYTRVRNRREISCLGDNRAKQQRSHRLRKNGR